MIAARRTAIRSGGRRGRAADLLGSAVIAALVLVPEAALAQASGVVERNLPPVATSSGGLRSSTGVAVAADSTPLGADVVGIRLIGIDDQVLTRPPAGVTVGAVEGLSAERLGATLAPFLGKPLSRKLVADAQAAVATAYREAGRPFVSVTAPPQEVTSGVLQLRVVAFRTGAVRVKDAAAGPDAAGTRFAGTVRAPKGEIIEAARISEDLDWINRYPYRQLNGVFEPGSRPGTSDLTLEVARKKPWQVFAGWSNTGTRETDYNRYFVGFSAGIEALNDLTLSYQLTGSGNLVSDPASIDLSGAHWPAYVSHAGRIVVPTFDRQALEITPSFVATSQASLGNILTFHNTNFELPILYRSALSNLDAGLAGWGDVYVGVAPKWASRKALYQGAVVASGSTGVFDLIAGWSGQWLHPDNGSTAIDLRLVANPGAVVSGNTSASWNTYSNGRVTDVHYAYVSGSLTQVTPLGAIPALAGWSWNLSLAGQIAGQALPDTEQLAIGGYYATRGYTLGDGSVDTGFSLRNELRLPVFAALGRMGAGTPGFGAVQDAVSPYLFADVGYGHNFNLAAPPGGSRNSDPLLVGVGAGLDYTLANNVRAGVIAGVALTNGPSTERGTVTVQARLAVSF